MAEGRVGCDAGEGIGTAAVEAQHDFGEREFGALLRGGALDVLADIFAGGFDGAERSA